METSAVHNKKARRGAVEMPRDGRVAEHGIDHLTRSMRRGRAYTIFLAERDDRFT